MSHNGAVDSFKRRGHLLRWCKVDEDNDVGLSHPKLEHDVGWDVAASEAVWIPPGEVRDVPTNIRLELPPTVWVEIRARSSMSTLVDPGYRGDIFALLRSNRSWKPGDTLDPVEYEREFGVEILRGERIAQVIFHSMVPIWDEQILVEHMVASQRGEAGFGSTGVL
jgi:dUTPase